jgi:hypothetical protein
MSERTHDLRGRAPLRRLYRWILAAAGMAAVGLGAVGVFVPGLPTTVFLIVATYCFARSCPWLEERLLRGRLFAPYLRFIDGREPMPRRAQVTALLLMWASVGTSLGMLAAARRLPAWLALAVLAAASVGTVAIFAAGRRRPRETQTTGAPAVAADAP